MNGHYHERSPWTVALTGGIASGKTAVSDRFAALGVPVIDTDLLAREVVAPGTEGLAAVAARFGESVLQPNGALDRRALREHIFADPEARRALEAITHPRIREALEAQLAALEAPYAIVVIPLLFETGWQARFDRVLLVDVPKATQKQRLMARDGISSAEAERILETQVSRAQRRAMADDVIDNTGDISQLNARVEALHGTYCNLLTKSD